MLNVFDIFILALGNWLQCCSLKRWAGIFIQELETLRNNLWATEKQSHYNQEVLILRKVQQEKWIAIQFPEEFPHNQDPFTKRVKGRWNQSAITGRMAACWDKDSQEDTPLVPASAHSAWRLAPWPRFWRLLVEFARSLRILCVWRWNDDSKLFTTKERTIFIPTTESSSVISFVASGKRLAVIFLTRLFLIHSS